MNNLLAQTSFACTKMYLEILFTVLAIPTTAVLFKFYFLLKKMDEGIETLTITPPDNNMRQHLVENYIKSQEEVDKMTDAEVNKVYLAYNKKVIDQTTDSFMELMATTYVNMVDKLIPIATNHKVQVVDHDKLANNLKKDVFVKSAMDRFFPSLYYKYGSFLAPFSVGVQTIGHLEKLNLTGIENGEPENNQEKTQSGTGGEYIE